MASAHYTLSSLLAPRRIPVSSKQHRKNHLRPKILKTITKPRPPTLPLLPSPPPIVSPQENNPRLEIPAGEPNKLEVSEGTAKGYGIFENVSVADIFKYGGMYFLGVLLLQTIYTVWAVGSYKLNQRREGDGKENGDGKTVSLPVNCATNVCLSEEQLLMENKIEEIKLMAREARRIESQKKGEEDEDFKMDDDEGAVSINRLGIEKEIGEQLLKLQNKINGSAKDISAALQSNSRAEVDRDVNKNVNKGNEALVFKKKFKFRSPSTKDTKTPKGFPGTRDWRASNVNKRDSETKKPAQDYGSDASDHAQTLPEYKQVNHQDIPMQKSVSSPPSEEGGNFVDDQSKVMQNHGRNLKEKIGKPNIKTEVGVKTRTTDNGGVQKTNSGTSSHEAIQSSKSRDLSTEKFHCFVEENQEKGLSLEKDDEHSIHGRSKPGLTKKNSAANGVNLKAKPENTKTDLWWLNLRYVFIILMRRDSEEGSEGLYSLKFTSNEQDQSDDSYTVAFEDHADANNFCFLLESFFEDLGYFSADAVPMSIQELNEEIISHAKKVVVVKKKQLQLYAGQPLADVEMALRSIIEQDQNAPKSH
ncbi:hypothetical protein VNO78_22706 [Psophocarpus tetragonolobus]|uniref:Uncharacterized protein n=1 Tax=Psophocarpus tetragonolobus TaxID=3891 RepID=A0AAN9S2B4_PSOTE